MIAITMDVTTDGSGDATVQVPLNITPKILYAVEWSVGTLAAGVDAVLSTENTVSGVDTTLLTLTDANANAWYFPRESEHDNAGVAVSSRTYPVVSGDLKLVVSSGGATATGTVVVYLGE